MSNYSTGLATGMALKSRRCKTFEEQCPQTHVIVEKEYLSGIPPDSVGVLVTCSLLLGMALGYLLTRLLR